MSKKLALKIYVDEFTGEVTTVQPSKRFEKEGPLFKIDVLKDAVVALEHIYEFERHRFINEMVIGAGTDGKIAKA